MVDECSMEDNKFLLNGIIVNKCSTEEYKSECVISKQKDANNEFTCNVPIYFKVLECGRKILNIIDVYYKGACMDTPGEEYYTKMVYTLVN